MSIIQDYLDQKNQEILKRSMEVRAHAATLKASREAKNDKDKQALEYAAKMILEARVATIEEIRRRADRED